MENTSPTSSESPINPGDIDVQVPDIPLPEPAPVREINDVFDAGFRFCFAGAGQGGSRLAATFSRLGYQRVCALNTAPQDLAHIDLPETGKLCLGDGGAGKDPAKAEKLFLERREDALEFMRRCFGENFDRIFICAGAGGGSGAGLVVPLVQTAVDLQKALRCSSEKVGVVLALPKISEGSRVSLNAYNTLTQVWDLVCQRVISPLILLDNERISQMFPKLAVDPFWDTANRSVAALFHLFNTLVIQSSHYSTFDRNDLKTILDSGLITFGAAPVDSWNDPSGISAAVRNNLGKNILCGGVNLKTGNIAGAVIIGSVSVLNTIPQLYLDQAFDQLNRLLKSGSTVHRGIYRGNKENLVVYTVIGGLALPDQKLLELRQTAGIP